MLGFGFWADCSAVPNNLLMINVWLLKEGLI